VQKYEYKNAQKYATKNIDAVYFIQKALSSVW